MTLAYGYMYQSILSDLVSGSIMTEMVTWEFRKLLIQLEENIFGQIYSKTEMNMLDLVSILKLGHCRKSDNLYKRQINHPTLWQK